MMMYSDGAVYLPDGTLHRRMQKIFPLTHLNAVIAGRGSPLFLSAFGALASIEASSFDQLKETTASIGTRLFADLRATMEAAGAGTECELVIAGLSEAEGPSSFFTCSHEHRTPAIRPWQVVDLDPISLAPHDSAIKAELDKAYPHGIHPDQFHPIIDGLRVLEIQRAHPVAHPGGGFGILPTVGAFAQLTTIRRDIITTRIIRRWPDEIGRPLAIG